MDSFIKSIIERAAKQPDINENLPDACPYMHLAEKILDNSINNPDKKFYLSHLTECEACRAMLTVEAASRREGLMEKMWGQIKNVFGLLHFPEPEQRLSQPIALRGESARECVEEAYTLRGGQRLVIKKISDETGRTIIHMESPAPMRKIEVFNLQKKLCFKESNTMTCEFELLEDCVAVIDDGTGIVITR